MLSTSSTIPEINEFLHFKYGYFATSSEPKVPFELPDFLILKAITNPCIIVTIWLNRFPPAMSTTTTSPVTNPSVVTNGAPKSVKPKKTNERSEDQEIAAKAQLRMELEVETILYLSLAKSNNPTIVKVCQSKKLNAHRMKTLLKAIPNDLSPDNAESMMASRTAWALVDPSGKRGGKQVMYTQSELQSCVYVVASGKLGTQAAIAKYGIPKSTIKERLIEFASLLGINETDYTKRKNDVKSYCNKNPFASLECSRLLMEKKRGPTVYLSKTENHVMANVIGNYKGAACGKDRPGARKLVKDTIQAKGQELMLEATEKQDRKLWKSAQRLINASVTASYMRKILSPEALLDIQEKGKSTGTFTADSRISSKRLQAASPLTSSLMTKKFLDKYAELFQQGILKTAQPTASQCWGADEAGITPEGNYKKTFSLNAPIGERPFHAQTGERNVFWTTILFATCADGMNLIDPMIVHQGGTDTDMPMKFVDGLGEDWVVSATSSGYMDQDSFYAYAVHFVQQTGASAENVKFLFIDGHDSHWSVKALAHFHNNFVFVFFLKSQNSINDQPNDMGPNAKWKAAYDAAFQNWRARYPTIQFVVGYQNSILVDAWNIFKSDVKLGNTVRKAWAKSNLFPMVDVLAGGYENVSEETRRLAKLSLPYADAKDATALNLIISKGAYCLLYILYI